MIDHLKLPEAPAILDLGGYPGTLATTLREKYPDSKIITADTLAEDQEGFVKLTGTKLPFEDKQFDLVVCTDVLEHIPPDSRTEFLQEAARVTKTHFLICFPFKQKASDLIETQLAETFEKLNGKPHPWLGEHREYGLPEFAFVASILEPFGLLHSSKSAPLKSWMTHQWNSLQYSISDALQEPWAKLEQQLNTLVINDLSREATAFGLKIQTPCYRLFLHLDRSAEPSHQLIESEELSDEEIEHLITLSTWQQLVTEQLSANSSASDLGTEINARIEKALQHKPQKKSLFPWNR